MPAQEVIVLEVDPTSALKAQQATNKGFDETEKRAKQASASIAETTEQASQQTIRIVDRSKNSIDRIASAAEKRASLIGKSALDRLESQRALDLGRVGGDPRAIDRVTQAYSKLIAEQKKVDAAASGFGNTLKQALENPRSALDTLIGGLTGLPGILAGGTIAIGALATGVVKIVSGLTDWAEQLQNTANATGLTRQEVQLFTIAAKQQGVSAEILDQLMRGLSKAMTDTSEEALRNRKELERLGVSFFDLGGKMRNPLELFEDIADVLGKIQDPYERARKAQELFGRSGIEGLKLFNSEFRQVIENTKQFGPVFDENVLNRIDAMDKKLDEASTAWDGWKKRGDIAILYIVELLNTLQLTYAATAKLLFGGGGTAAGSQQLSAVNKTQERLAREERERGAAVIAAFQRERAQGVTGLQERLGTLTEDRAKALARIGPGLGEAAARTAVAEVQRLDKEIAGVQARIKTIQEAPAKAEQAKRQQEAFEKAIYQKRIELIKNSEKEAMDSAVREAEWEMAQQERVAKARIEYQTETGAIQDRMRQTNFDQEQVLRERSRDEQLQALDAVYTRTVGQKIALEQKKLQIELEYAKEAEKLNIASIERQNEEEIRQAVITAQTVEDLHNRLDQLDQLHAQRLAIAKDNAEARIREIQQASANQQAKIMQAEYEKAFDRIQNAFEGLFDAMLTRSKSFGQAMLGMLEAVLLTPLKQAMSQMVAGLLTGRGTGAGLGGLFSGIAGLGGIGFPGAPGGTSGIAGPVKGIGGLAQLGGLGGLARAGGLGSAGLAAGLAPLLLGGATLGGFGAFKLGQRGGLLGGIGAPALGAVSGLVGMGALTAMFPALVAAGPIGWIAAAGIGATIGILGLLRGKAEDKVREKIQKAYGITIREKNILQNIASIAKQNFGGNIDLAIRSQPVMELISLYKMTTSGTGLGYSAAPTPYSAYQMGGSIYQTPGSPALTAPYPQPPSLTPTVITQIHVVGAQEFFQNETVSIISRNGRAVQTAAISAQKANAGRTQSTRLQLAPNLITSA